MKCETAVVNVLLASTLGTKHKLANDNDDDAK